MVPIDLELQRVLVRGMDVATNRTQPKSLSLPNILTYARIAAIPVVIGCIYAQSILGANVVLDLLAAIRDFIGGHSKSYERVLARAREDAMKNLVKEAEKLGANAILAVDLDYNTVGPNAQMLMVSVAGTAVVL